MQRRAVGRLSALTLLTLVLSTGIAQADVIVSTLDSTAPVQGVNYFNQVTGQILGPRLFRDGVPSSCATTKPTPGPFSTGTFRYDAYTFTAVETTCVTIRLRRIGAVGVIHAQVHSTFNPADASQGWLADSGSSVSAADGTVAFSLNVTAGQSYILVVNNVNSGEEAAQYEVSFEEPFTGTTTSTLDATVPDPDVRYFGVATGTFTTNRINRNGIGSSCGAPKPFPGTLATTGTHRYDFYQFVSPVSGCVIVNFRRTGAIGGVQVAAYSAFNPGNLTAGWLADSGYSSGGAALSFSMDVTAGQVFTLVAFNPNAGEEGAQYELDVTMPVQAPRVFRTATVAGNTVSFRWLPPLNGPSPTNYVIEGGVNPGEVLASIPVGSGQPILNVTVPNGAFYVRARALNGTDSSVVSNEIRIFVNALVPPSPPDGLLGTVNGSTLALTWRNTFAGGAPTGALLDVTGSASTTIPLGAGETAAFTGVPGGTYTLRLRSRNAAGASTPSNPLTVTFPGACSGIPQPPSRFLAYKTGNRITVLWDAPATGPAPTSYVLQVGGSLVTSIPTATRTLSGVVGAGSYNLSVRSVNICGSSVTTPVQTVTIP